MTSLNSHVYCDTLYNVESSLQNLLFIFYSSHDSHTQNIPFLQLFIALNTILVFFHSMLDRDRRDKGKFLKI